MTLMITSARTGVIDWPITVSLFSSLPILMVGIFCRSVGPVDRRLQRARVARDLRNAHEAVGQVVRFGCRGGSRSPYLRPGILAAFGAIIRYSLLCRERVAWHLEDRLSWDGLPSSRLASGAFGSQRGPRSRVLWPGQAEKYLMKGACAKPRGALGHARSCWLFN